MFSILFLCTGNSARSQLAEALFRKVAGDRFEVFSAGTYPQDVDPRVYQVLDLLSVSPQNLSSKTLQELPQQSFDFVITLCDQASRECAAYPESQALMHWDMVDPKPLDGVEPFLESARFLEQKIRLFLQLNSLDRLSPLESPTDLFKILSDGTRLRILMMIEDEKELCVSELVGALNESQPKISRHLAQMRDVGILEVRRQGQMMFYHLAHGLPDWCQLVLETVRIGNPAFINNEKIRLKALSVRASENEPELT
ncbi:metalloregulator ArsR/SmtB family transcription factor [Sansalvadorimonas sp. 2012CJ34-2]|uniref:Metalloregulator ArsR/SmtB family transcription factor n=1 Tax=Parendozoicomonas callyspongiae TaxID=2942213 RepID=A0ABT0PC36_9GAMM|nr:metalloregulator ArsR/SmtB family transcription factor [Sansalvadorimonas sp. 2012CJ34-2]MCL6268853.1 metalloregulator ArsR/SmtB family transcription factor [Sansalvadorimonas sp. 2012CJ34-2]